jgi:uncharacterized protein YacL
MVLWILRAIFLAAAAGLAVSVINHKQFETVAGTSIGATVGAFTAILLICLLTIGGDLIIRKKRIEVITCVYFGVVIGLFLTYVLTLALEPLRIDPDLSNWIRLVFGLATCYVCISTLIQTRDDFRFIIPYVEFSKEVKGGKPYVLDTSVVIDGRIADLMETGIIDNQLIMPRFVLSELQAIADSGDKLKRARGRRGLDILNHMRGSRHCDLKVHDRETPEMIGQSVDMKLVLLAKHLEGKVVTNDYNLNKVARLQNVNVVNLNDIANSLKPVHLPGEELEVRIIKQGEALSQGVGYLDDGTMIVVEGGREHIGQSVKIAVTSVLQTSAGRMIFGRYHSQIRQPQIPSIAAAAVASAGAPNDSAGRP